MKKKITDLNQNLLLLKAPWNLKEKEENKHTVTPALHISVEPNTQASVYNATFH